MIGSNFVDSRIRGCQYSKKTFVGAIPFGGGGSSSANSSQIFPVTRPIIMIPIILVDLL